mmetsp:Transcript_31046/g.99205  ORF Transcript_31046/g.99205 Transcript_31046/m.99205 type:complete len:313 (-) Transcript_31046:310-1248(-)
MSMDLASELLAARGLDAVQEHLEAVEARDGERVEDGSVERNGGGEVEQESRVFLGDAPRGGHDGQRPLPCRPASSDSPPIAHAIAGPIAAPKSAPLSDHGLRGVAGGEQRWQPDVLGRHVLRVSPSSTPTVLKAAGTDTRSETGRPDRSTVTVNGACDQMADCMELTASCPGRMDPSTGRWLIETSLSPARSPAASAGEPSSTRAMLTGCGGTPIVTAPPKMQNQAKITLKTTPAHVTSAVEGTACSRRGQGRRGRCAEDSAWEGSLCAGASHLTTRASPAAPATPAPSTPPPPTPLGTRRSRPGAAHAGHS